MNLVSRTITGIGLMILGVFLIVIALIFRAWVVLIYGVPLLVLGIYIFFNKKEDQIEEIKYSKMKGGKK